MIINYHTYILVNVTKKPPTAILYVSPKMTKFEINQYLTKIYNIAVTNVSTENILGITTIIKSYYDIIIIIIIFHQL